MGKWCNRTFQGVETKAEVDVLARADTFVLVFLFWRAMQAVGDFASGRRALVAFARDCGGPSETGAVCGRQATALGDVAECFNAATSSRASR